MVLNAPNSSVCWEYESHDQGWSNWLYISVSIVLVLTTCVIQLWTSPCFLYLLSTWIPLLVTSLQAFILFSSSPISHCDPYSLPVVNYEWFTTSIIHKCSYLTLSPSLLLSVCLSVSSPISLLTIPFFTFSAAPFGECAGEEDKTWKRWRAVSLPWLEHWLHSYLFSLYQPLCSSAIPLCVCIYVLYMRIYYI